MKLDRWWIAGIVAFPLFAAVRTFAAPPVGVDPTLAPFFQGLQVPGTFMSCCGAADCRVVRTRLKDGHREVYIAKGTGEWQFPSGIDAWVSVPAATVLAPQTNPMGEPVACWTPLQGIICFLEASGV